VCVCVCMYVYNTYAELSSYYSSYFLSLLIYTIFVISIQFIETLNIF
jgi:hypothetical protein